MKEEEPELVGIRSATYFLDTQCAYIFRVQHFIDRPDNRATYLHVRATLLAIAPLPIYN